MDFSSVPVGFGMALARNEAAVNAYAMMTKEQKQAILEKAHRVSSAQEMQQLLSQIIDQA